MKFNSILIFLLHLWFAGYSQWYTEEKTLTQVFKIGPETVIEINNKYGKIHLVPWDIDSVQIEINQQISSTNQSRLEKISNNIRYDFTNTDYYVTAKTEFGRNYSSLISDLRNRAEVAVTDNNVQINYTVHLPRESKVQVTNKYGDVYTGDLGGEVKIYLANGDLRAGRLSGFALLDVSFGNAQVIRLERAELVSSYADILVRESQNISIDSKSSKIVLEMADIVKLQSRRDKVAMNKINNLYGNTYFSSVTIDRLGSETSLGLKYGNISIEQVSKGFAFINLVSEYADIGVTMSRGSAVTLDVTYSPDVLLNLPQEADKLDAKPVGQDNLLKNLYGKLGQGVGDARVRIHATKKCNIQVVRK